MRSLFDLDQSLDALAAGEAARVTVRRGIEQAQPQEVTLEVTLGAE